MLNNSNNDIKAWDSYWSQGYKTSFGALFNNGYEGIIKNIWERFFINLTGANEVLDLCTGNASLLRLGKQTIKASSQIKLTGVDYADIRPQDSFGEEANIDLLFNVNIEKLPFRNNSFDYVISNFGFEYSDIKKSINEVARILKPGGKVLLVCHCFDSILIKSNSEELLLLEEMFEKNNVLDSLTGLIDALNTKEQNSLQKNTEVNSAYQNASEEAEKYRIALNARLTDLAKNHHQALEESEFLVFLKFLLNKNTKDKVEVLAQQKIALFHHKLRLKAMVDAALSCQTLESFASLLAPLGFKNIEIENVLDNNNKIAIKITANIIN